MTKPIGSIKWDDVIQWVDEPASIVWDVEPASDLPGRGPLPVPAWNRSGGFVQDGESTFKIAH